MAFVLPNLSPPSLALLQLKDNKSSATCVSSPLTLTTKPISSFTKLDSPPNRVALINQAPPGGQKHQNDDFYVNIGLAVRTLREDMPLLFTKDLNYDIYRYPFLLFLSFCELVGELLNLLLRVCLFVL